VDPAGGTNVGASGTDSTGCRFATLTYALSVAVRAPTYPATPVTIRLLSDLPSTESYPIVLPQNVTVQGWNSGTGSPAPRQVIVPAGRTGFSVTANNVGLSYLAIVGTVPVNPTNTQRFSQGIVASSATTTPITGVVIDHVSVTNSLRDGIDLGGSIATATGTTYYGAIATIGPGVTITGAGYVSTGVNIRSSGLRVLGNAAATITGGTGVDQTSFVSNTEHGISVVQLGHIAISSTAPITAPFDGAPVIARGNAAANLSIAQTPIGAAGSAPPMPLNTVTGLVSFGGTINGIRVEGGSRLQLRGSVSLANGANGVHVVNSGWPTTGANAASTADVVFLGGIDVGTDTSTNKGGNLLQAPGATVGFSANQNHGAGVCLSITAVAMNGQTLNAAGNMLAGSGVTIDCATAAANTAVVQNNTCASAANAVPTSVGVTGTMGGMNANKVKLDNCVGR
jgi:hypothetical protein